MKTFTLQNNERMYMFKQVNKDLHHAMQKGASEEMLYSIQQKLSRQS